MNKQRPIEYCYRCSEPTGHAGRGDGSLYVDAITTGREVGPLCDRCYSQTCGFCGELGADKMPHPIHWPGEMQAGTELVHAECEQDECIRASKELSPQERERFLKSIR